jgi:hypothetical protein
MPYVAHTRQPERLTTQRGPVSAGHRPAAYYVKHLADIKKQARSCERGIDIYLGTPRAWLAIHPLKNLERLVQEGWAANEMLIQDREYWFSSGMSPRRKDGRTFNMLIRQLPVFLDYWSEITKMTREVLVRYGQI